MPGTATGIGSMPGTDPLEAARVVAGELPDFPHLAELPGRGPGADITGRAAALLVDIPAEVTPRGWRIAERPGRDLRRARSMLSSDLDAMEEVLDGYDGLLKVQVCGPWTLAATLEQPRSLNAALADPGLVADLAASLAEGAAAHVAEVAKRVPRATLAVQFDEPALPAVAAGAVPTASGLSRIRAVEEEVLRDRLHQVLSAAARPGGSVGPGGRPPVGPPPGGTHPVPPAPPGPPVPSARGTSRTSPARCNRLIPSPLALLASRAPRAPRAPRTRARAHRAARVMLPPRRAARRLGPGGGARPARRPARGPRR